MWRLDCYRRRETELGCDHRIRISRPGVTAKGSTWDRNRSRFRLDDFCAARVTLDHGDRRQDVLHEHSLDAQRGGGDHRRAGLHRSRPGIEPGRLGSLMSGLPTAQSRCARRSRRTSNLVIRYSRSVTAGQRASLPPHLSGCDPPLEGGLRRQGLARLMQLARATLALRYQRTAPRSSG